MSFTAKDVQTLRERTGVGMMDCKKCLAEAGGDMDKAVGLLREKGLAAAAKKAGRLASEGMVLVELSDGVGAVVEVNSETDFVSKNTEFQEFVKTIAQTILKQNPADLDALLKLKADGSDMTVEELLREKVLTIGENLVIRRFDRFEGALQGYIHGGGTHAVLVQFDTDLEDKAEFTTYAKNVAMHIAAANPVYLSKDNVPADVVEKEKEILTAQAMNEGKPKEIAEKMVMGRIKKFFEENCLLEQKFVMDTDKTVAQYTADTAKELGGKIELKGFVRYEKGEGLEKKEDDFAAEVAGMMK